MPGQLKRLIWPHNPVPEAAAKYRRACEYEAYIPDPLASLSLSLPAATAGLLSDAEAEIRALNSGAMPALAPLARLLLRTESIASSKVEGMQMGARELARAEAKMETGRGTSQTAQEILANIDAMELAIDQAAKATSVTAAEILAIHHRLMERSNNRIAGRFRTEQNWIGGNDYNPCGSDFVPPPAEELPRLLDDLCRAMNDDLLPALVQAALVHAQFETIHPFDDGNGRTGRALIHVILKRRGVAPAYVPPISVVIAASKERYIDGLTRFRQDERGVGTWVEHFASAAGRSARLAKQYLGEVEGLMEEWRTQLTGNSNPRSDAAAWTVIDILPAHPIITAPVAAAASGRSKAPIYEALEQLEKARVLVPLTQSRKNRSWEAVGLLDLLARLEAGQMQA